MLSEIRCKCVFFVVIKNVRYSRIENDFNMNTKSEHFKWGVKKLPVATRWSWGWGQVGGGGLNHRRPDRPSSYKSNGYAILGFTNNRGSVTFFITYLPAPWSRQPVYKTWLRDRFFSLKSRQASRQFFSGQNIRQERRTSVHERENRTCDIFKTEQAAEAKHCPVWEPVSSSVSRLFTLFCFPVRNLSLKKPV